MKLDMHVHTFHSGYSTIWPLHSVLRESYNTPEGVYALARKRGMDLVTITDHDQISAALELGDRPDVIVGSEVTGGFPGTDVSVHLNVFGLDPARHVEVQRLREDVRELMPYLRRERLFTSLNHVGSSVAGPLTGAHVAALLPWVDALEVINGSRLPVQNRTAQCLAAATGMRGIAGSDAHHRRGVGQTWTEVPGATSRDEFMAGLWEGRVVATGRHGSYFTMAEDILRFSGSFYKERVQEVLRRPWGGQAHAKLWGGVLGLPLVGVALAGAYVHFVGEERFNHNLLFDLVARPSRVLRAVPDLAA
ncbi:MAG: PHP-associated domain-containing protein [Vicinamibacterales bacterium]